MILLLLALACHAPPEPIHPWDLQSAINTEAQPICIGSTNCIQRLKTPEGWLVIGRNGSTTTVSDPEHTWAPTPWEGER